MDITTLGIAMDTSGLAQGEAALNSATAAANKAADAMDAVSESASNTADGASKLASQYSGLSQASTEAAANSQKYLAALKQEYDLLGLNRGETEAYIAQAKGMTAVEQQLAAALGAKIDAWNRDEAAAKASAAAQDRAAASADQFIAKLQAQAQAASMTRAELLQMQAAQLGVSQQAAPLIAQLEGASAAAGHMGGATAYARTEMLRLVNDIANGNFSRFEQTGMVLAEQYDLLGKMMSPLGLAIGGVTAAIALSAVTAVHAAESMAQYGESLTKLSQQTGISTDELQKIGYGLETVGGKSTDSGVALDTLAKKISAAQYGSQKAQADFQALGISLSDLKNLSMDQVLGKIADKFSQTADDAGKFAVSQQLFGSAAKDMIAYLDQGSAGLAELGVQAQNVGAVLDQSTIAQMNRLGEELNTIHANMGAVSMNAKTELLPVIGTITDALVDLSREGGVVGTVFDVMSGIIAGSAAVIATAILPLKLAAQSMVTTFEVVSKGVTGDFKGAKDALISGWQEEMDAGKKYADFMKNLFYPQSVGGDGLDFGSAGGWDPKISPQKPSSTRSAGLIDKTQLQGEVQAVKDELAQELAYVKSSQTELDALYKSGGIGENAYYTQTRDNIMKTASERAKAFDDEAAILAKGLTDHKLSAAQHATLQKQIDDLHAKSAEAIESGMLGIADSAAKEQEALDKVNKSFLDSIDKQIDAADKQDQSLRDQIDTFGKTKTAVDQLNVSRADEALATMEADRAERLRNDDMADTKAIDARINKEKELVATLRGVATDQATLDDQKQVQKQQDDLAKTWQQTIDGVGTDFHNGFLQMLGDGKKSWSSFTDSLKNTFETTVVNELYKAFAQKWVINVVANIAGITGGSALQQQILQNNGMAGGGNGTFSNMLSNPSGTYNNLSNGYDTVMQWMQGYGGASTALGSSAISGASTGAMSAGGVTLGGLGAGMSADAAASSAAAAQAANVGANTYGFTAGAGAGGSGGMTAGLGSGLMYGGAGLLGGLAGGALFNNKGYSSLGGSIGAMGGMAIGASSAVAGTTVGTELGSLAGPVGAVIGMALGALVGSLIGGGETRYGADYTINSADNVSKVRGPSGGDPGADQVQTSIKTTYDSITSLAKQLGGSTDGLGQYSAAYEVSPQKGNSFVSAGFGDLSGYPNRQNVDSKDSTTVLNDFSLQLQRSVISALQQANLDSPYAAVLQGVDASKLSATDITSLLSELNSLKSLFDSFQSLSSAFDNLKGAGTTAQMNVINLAGGITTLNTEMSYFAQHFTSAAEQTTAQAKSVTDQLAKLGESGVTTNDQFRAAVQGIDLTTAAGQQLYQQMLALAPAFDQMTTAAKQAADAQQSLWNQYFSSIYTSSQQVAMSTKQLQAQFDALGVAMPKSNADFQALVENMDTSTQPMKDLQNELLALAPAFGQLTTAATQAVSTALGNVQTAYNSQVQAINANITSISNFITQLTNLKQSLSLGSLSTLSPQDKYNAEKQLFESTSASAAAGDATAQGNLPQVAQDFLAASQAYNASSQAYVNDYNEVQKSLDANIASAQQQLSVAQQQLDATNQMVQGILNLNTTAQSLSDALKAYFDAGGTTSAATGAAAAGTYGGSAGGNLNRAQVEATAVNGLIPYSAANPYGPMGGYSVADWKAANAAGPSAAFLAANPWIGQLNAINGSHAGGLDSVPFDGYRAELHKGEAVVTSVNNQKLSQMLNIDWSRFGNGDQTALLNEIKALRAEVAATRQSQQQIAAVTLQQGQQQHAESQAVRTKQARQLQTVGDNTGRIASKR